MCLHYIHESLAEVKETPIYGCNQMAIHRTAILFFSLLNELPDNLQIDDLLAYFQTTWIEGLATGRRVPGNALFPPETWNCFDRTLTLLPRTNNFVDAWNKKFSGLIGHSNPTNATIWNFWRKFISSRLLSLEKLHLTLLVRSHQRERKLMWRRMLHSSK